MNQANGRRARKPSENGVKINRKKNLPKPDYLTMDIDTSLAGTIVGVGGGILKKLRKESGATIAVSKSSVPGQHVVQIGGSREAKECARQLVGNIIKVNVFEKSRESLQKKQESGNEFNRSVGHENTSQKEKSTTFLPVLKNLYEEVHEIASLTEEEVANFRSSMNETSVKYMKESGGNVKPIPNPVLEFSHAFSNYPALLTEISQQPFEQPTPVQCQVWPVIMSGHDTVAVSQDGTGKTLAYLLPAFLHIDYQLTPRNKRKGPSAIVSVLTEELAVYVASVVCMT